MKKMMTTVGLACLALASCNEPQKQREETPSTDTATTTQSVPATEEKAWVPIDSAEGMKAYMEYATPGDAHKELAKWDGKWTGEATMWERMDGKPMKSTLQATNKMIFGGRYQQATYNGQMMGMAFEGTGITAYDNSLKKYVATWVDNMGTGIMRMEGTRDDATKSITYTGTAKNPVNGMECEMKEVLTDIDENTQKMEMYGSDPQTGKQFKKHGNRAKAKQITQDTQV